MWLSDLGEDHPATHDLCPHHADNLRVPKGWSLVDERQPAPVVHEPSAAEIVERVATLRETVDRRLEQGPPPVERRSRYEDLLDDLPTYNPDGTKRYDEPAGRSDAMRHDDASRRNDAEANSADVVSVTASTVRVVEHATPSISHEMAPVPRNLPALAAAIAEQAAKDERESERAVVLTLPVRAEVPTDDHPSDQ